MSCGHQKTVQGTNACWQYCAGFLWDWRNDTAKRRTNAEVKSEQQESVMIPFIKESAASQQTGMVINDHDAVYPPAA